MTSSPHESSDTSSSQAMIRTLLDTIPDIAWMKDPQGRFIVVNEPFAEAAGRTPAQAIGTNDFDLWPRELAEKYRADDAMVIASGKRKSIDEQFIGIDGQVHWIETIKSPVVDDGGRVIATTGIARDITSRRRQEKIQATLYVISAAASGIGDMASFYATVHEALAGVINAKNFYVAICDDAMEETTFPYWVDEHDPQPPARKLGQGLTGNVIRSGRPLLYEREKHEEPEAMSDVERLGSPAISWLGVPLRDGASIFGAIVVQSYDRKSSYGDEELNILTFVSGQIASAIIHKRQAESLRLSEERYALAARGANDGLWDWNVRDHVVHYSERWASILGHTPADLQPTIDEWMKRIHHADADRVGEELHAHLQGKTHHFQSEHRLRDSRGGYRWVLVRGVAVRDEGGIVRRVAGSLTDITTRKEAEERIHHDALHDSLTGLPNRSLFTDRVAQSIQRARRKSDYMFSVLFLDIDRFKLVNDTYGHLIGDRLLVGFAQRLKNCLRAADTVSRLGGDEFTILLDGMTRPDEAQLVALRILAAFQSPLLIEGTEFSVRTSIGIVVGCEEHARPNDCLRDADIALYRAKEEGRGRHVTFEPSMRGQRPTTSRIEGDVRRGLDAGEFFPTFLPVVSLSDGTTVGFRALPNWKHPVRGVLAPEDFAGLTEDVRLLSRLDNIVLEQSLARAASQDRAEPCVIHVDLGMHRLQDLTFLQTLDALMAATTPPPGTLSFSFSEEILTRLPGPASRLIPELRRRGIGVMLEGFGRGQLALSHLYRFPLDGIALDSSLVARLATDSNEALVVQGVITLAKQLGLKVHARGVDSSSQAGVLRSMGCDAGCGSGW